MDRLDRKILHLLQENATLSVADIAKKLGFQPLLAGAEFKNLKKMVLFNVVLPFFPQKK